GLEPSRARGGAGRLARHRRRGQRQRAYVSGRRGRRRNLSRAGARAGHCAGGRLGPRCARSVRAGAPYRRLAKRVRRSDVRPMEHPSKSVVSFAVKTPPQHGTWAQFLDVWRAADEIDVFESAWTMDHFYPLTPPMDGPHLESRAMLAALAQATK